MPFQALSSLQLLLLLVRTCCTALAAPPDSSGKYPSCLLQTGQHSYPSPGLTLSETSPDHVHSLEADAHHVRDATSFAERFVESAGRPNGATEMHKTNMNQDDLPRGSRHIDTETWTSDWSAEYPPFVRFNVTPELVTPPISSVTPAAVWAVVSGWPCRLLGLCTRWLLVLGFLGCLILLLLLCLLLCARGNSRKQTERFQYREAPWDRVFIQASEEVYMPPRATTTDLPPRAPENRLTLATQPHDHRLVPMASVGVDSTGDGHSNYTYTGTDQNYDGVPDSLGDGKMLVPATAGAVDGQLDGHPSYLYTLSEECRDDTPDSLQLSQDSPDSSLHVSEHQEVLREAQQEAEAQQEVQQEAATEPASSSSAISASGDGDRRDSVQCSFPSLGGK